MFVRLYKGDDREAWDNFVQNASDNHFIFTRTFIEYHKLRFNDHSLIIHNEKGIIALLPACIEDDHLYAHKGLPFCDIICRESLDLTLWSSILNTIQNYVVSNGIKKITITCPPSIYKSNPEESKLYFLRAAGFQLVGQKLTCAIDLPNHKHDPSKWRITNSMLNKYTIEYHSDDYKSFHALLADQLHIKYNAKPVHSLSELEYLKSQFGNNIQLISCYFDGAMVGGILLFVYRHTLKVQYMVSTLNNVMDIMTIQTIAKYQDKYRYYDIGTSNSLDNDEINYGNLRFKIKHGGSGFVIDKYEWCAE